MIIEKNMNIKIDLDSDLVSEYFKHCLDNTTELSNIVDKLDDNILSYIAAYYVGKVSREDPEQYAKFKKFLPHSIDDEKSEINPETKSSDTPAAADKTFMGTFGGNKTRHLHSLSSLLHSSLE